MVGQKLAVTNISIKLDFYDCYTVQN